MNSHEYVVRQLLDGYEEYEGVQSKISYVSQIYSKFSSFETVHIAFVLRQLGYLLRHDIFLSSLANYLNIPETSDVTVSYIEHLLVSASGIDVREFDSYIKYTPDLVKVQDNVCHLIDAKVRATAYVDLEETYRKYYDAYFHVVKKYDMDLSVSVVCLEPHFRSLTCYPEPESLFKEGKTTAELIMICQNKYESVFDWINEMVQGIDEKYRMDAEYQGLSKKFETEVSRECMPWFVLKDNNEYFVELLLDPAFADMKTTMTPKQFKDFKEDILHYNILLKPDLPYYNERLMKLTAKLREKNALFMSRQLEACNQMKGKEHWSFMPPKENRLRQAFAHCEEQSTVKFEPIRSVLDFKPSFHFIWFPVTESFFNDKIYKGVENDYKLARFVSACKGVHVLNLQTSDRMFSGACALVTAISKSCDITADVPKFTRLINELREENENAYVAHEFGNVSCKFTKNYTFKIKSHESKGHLLEWTRSGKGYKKLKEMNPDELAIYLAKRNKVIDMTSESLRYTCENKWNDICKSLTADYSSEKTTLHQLDHFIKMFAIEDCSQQMADLIQNSHKNIAAGCLKDISLMFSNAVATSARSSRGSLKFYFCKNPNICLCVLPSNSLLNKGTHIVYTIIGITSELSHVNNYNLEENIAFMQKTEFIDKYSDCYSQKWLVISKPFRLDKSRLMHLLSCYENYTLLFSIQAHLFCKSIEKGKIYTGEERKQWLENAIGLSFFGGCNITKSATTITDASRYIVNNCIADYSNAYEYITEKFEPKPKTLYSFILYLRLKSGCLRLNAQSKYIVMRKIQFRESDMINSGIDMCNIQGIYNPYLTCTSLIDVIIENQTLFYSCMKEIHNPVHNIIKLYKTPLTYEKEFRDLWESSTKKDFLSNSNDFSIDYETFCGAVADVYAGFGDALYQVRRDILKREGFSRAPVSIKTLTSAKSCITKRNLNIPFIQDLMKFKSIQNKEEMIKYMDAFNKTYKTSYRYDESERHITLSKKFIDRQGIPLVVSDYIAVDSTRVFDELANILDNPNEIFQCINYYYMNAKSDVDSLTTLDLVFWAINNSSNNLNFTVFAKGQRTADDREIYQGTYINKLGLYFIEHTFKHLCQIHPDEMISEGGDRKVFKMNSIRKQCYAKLRDLREEQIAESRDLEDIVKLTGLTKQEKDRLECAEGLSKENVMKRFIDEVLSKDPARIRLKPLPLRTITSAVEDVEESVLSSAQREYYKRGVTQVPRDEKSQLCLLEINADQSKWSARDLTYKFILAVSLCPLLYPVEKMIMIKFLINYTKKNLIITDEVMAILKNQIHTKDMLTTEPNIFHEMTEGFTKNHIKITQNWLQGNFNYLSSFIHTCAMHVLSRRLEYCLNDSWGAQYIKTYSMVHSDDNNTAVVMKIKKETVLGQLFNDEMLGWFLMDTFIKTVKEFSIHVNDKKTNVSRLVKEFISQYNIAGEQCSPWQRIILPILSNSNFLSAMEDIYGLCSHIQEAVCHNTPPSIVRLAQAVMHSYIYSAYGFGYEGYNDPVKIFDVDRNWIPIQLGGVLSAPSYLLSVYGPSCNEPWKLKNLLVKMYKERSKQQGTPIQYTSLDLKIHNLDDDLLKYLTRDEQFFLKYHLYFDPVNKLDVDVDDNLQIIDPDSLRPKILLRPRAFITGKYLSKFYSMRLYNQMRENNSIGQFILENPDLTFCKPVKNSLFSRWNALKFSNANFVQSLSLQNRAQLLLDKIVFKKGNMIKESFIEDYMSKQLLEIQFEEDKIESAQITYVQALTKVNDIISNVTLNLQAVKDLLTSALLSNKYLQILMEIDECIVKEEVVKNTGNYIVKFRTLYHSHETVNPPTKIVKHTLYPGLTIQADEVLFKNYLPAEKNHLMEYLGKTKYYNTFKTVFQDIYNTENLDELRESIRKLKEKYPETILIKIISKINDTAFGYLTMYSYRKKLMFFKSYCPANHLFINYLIGSNLIDNAFVNISLSNEIIYRKNLEISTVLAGIPTITHLCNIIYSYFNFIEACVKKEYRVIILQETLHLLYYQNYNVIDYIRYSNEPASQMDKKLCLIFLYFFSNIDLTPEELNYAVDYLNGEGHVIATWNVEHISRANRLGPFDVCYRTRLILVRIIGVDQRIHRCIIKTENQEVLSTENGIFSLDRIFRRIVRDFEFSEHLFHSLDRHTQLEPQSLYMRKSTKRTELIRTKGTTTHVKDMALIRYICPITYMHDPKLRGRIYTLNDIKYVVDEDTDLQNLSTFEVCSVIRLRVGGEKDGFNIRVRKKEYKKLLTAKFRQNFFIGHINWGELIHCPSLLSSLDKGCDMLNCGDIYKLVIDLQHPENKDDIVLQLGQTDDPFEQQEFKPFLVDTTEPISDVYSDVTWADSQASYSIITFPFGSPVMLYDHIKHITDEIENFLYGLVLVINAKEISMVQYQRLSYKEPRNYINGVAKLCAIIKMFESNLDNGLRSSCLFLYHAMLYIAHRNSQYNTLKSEFTRLMHEYNYPMLGYSEDYNEQFINTMKEKFNKYTILEQNKDLATYWHTVKKLSNHIEEFQKLRQFYREKQRLEVEQTEQCEEQDIQWEEF